MSRDDFPSAIDTLACFGMRFRWRRAVASVGLLPPGWWRSLQSCPVRR